MVANTVEWRKTYGADAIAADNSVPECLSTIARLWVRTARGARTRRPSCAARAQSAQVVLHSGKAHAHSLAAPPAPSQGRARSGHQVLWFEYGPLAQQAAWGAWPHMRAAPAVVLAQC